jgi:hypothetical protein
MRWFSAHSRPRHQRGNGPELVTVDIGQRFRQAWTTGDQQTATPELLPVRLARAARAVLPVSGAGLSLINDRFRVPLGASDDDAAAAERLQFTHGEGPCLDAARAGRPVAVEEPEIRERWPMFAQELFDTTPFVALISVPLPLSTDVHSVLDLFLTRSRRVTSVSLSDATVVSDQIVNALQVATAITGNSVPWLDVPDPDWLHSPAAQDRRNVWVAMGMLMTRMKLTAEDALSTLRGYAYSHDTVVDDVAADLVAGALDVDQVVAV